MPKMENSRIPKSGLRPPTKILKPGMISKPIMPVVPEGKPVSFKDPAKSSVQAEKPKPNNVLRRRSKSVSDLRPLMSRPLTTNAKVPDKSALTKSGVKRPASSKIGDESKPKISKVRIPDWDYKSRFNELQKKHTVVQDEVKQMKSKFSDYIKLEEEVETLRENNVSFAEKLQSLERSHSTLTSSNDHLFKENADLKAQLSDKKDACQRLQTLCDKLQDENREKTKKIQDLDETLKETNHRNEELIIRIHELESSISQLKQDLDEHDNLRRSLHNTIQDMKGNIRVFCRVRPPINNEENDKTLCSIFFPTDSSLEIKKSRESVSTISGKAVDLRQEFSFDKVFPPEANQAEVFEELAQLVQSALDGYNVCVFAYGQTGSGKTYTMLGSTKDCGMIPRTIDLIFEKVAKLSLTDWKYTVAASFLEIYNENIRDLLVPNSTYNYELRYNEGRGVTVTNLKIVPICSSNELQNLMDEAHRNRAVAATDFNEHSSRSHAVTKIYLEGYNSATKAQYCGSINLVDLAGSESARTTSAERLAETKNINKSLATLGNVMLALHNKDSHVPYRNSKLTFLLQSCLGGNSKTLMFVNISPFEECFGESVNSLRFASKVKEIKTSAKKNKAYCMPPPTTPKN